MRELEEGLVFTNLVDFDMLWGHRNDPAGFAAGLEEVDAAVPELIASCGENDLMIITADHGCDPWRPEPTTPGSTYRCWPVWAARCFHPEGRCLKRHRRNRVSLAASRATNRIWGNLPMWEPRSSRFFTDPKLEITEALKLGQAVSGHR